MENDLLKLEAASEVFYLRYRNVRYQDIPIDERNAEIARYIALVNATPETLAAVLHENRGE